MSYIKEHLLQSEHIILITQPHWVIFASGVWALLFSVYIGFFAPGMLNAPVYNQWTTYNLVAAGLAVIGAYWLIQAYIAYMTSEYAVTDKRVVMKVGWIRRNSLEIMIEKVEGVLVNQTVMGRIFNYGAITMIGTGGTKDMFAYIPAPLTFRRTVQQQIDDIENKHG